MFEWNNEYKVGIKDIDEQHEKLFSLLRELHEASTVGKGRTVVEKVLTGVVNYTQYHFGTEEKLMLAHSYSDYAVHKHMHDALVAQAAELLEKTRKSSLTVSIDVMKFLESWIAHHISEADRKLGRFLAAAGVK